MNFVHPWFLFALTALAIPVIIHLFSFRRYKKVFFPNIRFLKELKEETRSYRRVKHLLILLMRLLTIFFLVLAFAQPFIPSDKTSTAISGNKSLHLFIDNSFSMQSLGKNSDLLEEAKRSATDIINSHRSSDQFQVLTNDFEGRHQRYYTKDEAVQLVNEIGISSVTRTDEEIMQRQKDLIHAKKSSSNTVFILSDFQRSSFNPENLKPDSALTVNLIPLQPQSVKNIYIDSVWFNDPVRRQGKQEKLNIRIRNSSEEDLESVPVKLFINNVQKGLTSVDLEAGTYKDTVITFVAERSGITKGKVAVTDHPVSFDDAFYFSYRIPEKINVLAINAKEENPYIYSMLGTDSTFRYTSTEEKRLDYSTLKDQQLVILNELPVMSSGLASELSRFMENGGSILLIPSEHDLKGYDQLLDQYGIIYGPVDTSQTQVQQLISEHPLFSGVFEKKPDNIDLPLVHNHYPVQASSRSRLEFIMKLADGTAFIGSRKAGKGNLYVSSSAFRESSTSFVKHALFVPLVYNIALYSTPPAKLFYTIGNGEPVVTSTTQTVNEQVFRLKSDTGRYEFIPEARKEAGITSLYVHDNITVAGNYSLLLGNENISAVSFNYNRKESVMNFHSPDDLEKMDLPSNFHILDITDGKASVALEELSEGKRLWKLCIILALLFVLAEILIIKFWKNEGPLKVSADR